MFTVETTVDGKSVLGFVFTDMNEFDVYISGLNGFCKSIEEVYSSERWYRLSQLVYKLETRMRENKDYTCVSWLEMHDAFEMLTIMSVGMSIFGNPEGWIRNKMLDF